MKLTTSVAAVTLSFLLTNTAPFLPSAQADVVIQPQGGKGWGDTNTTDSLLKMNRDPEIIRKDEVTDSAPILVKGTCTDSQGKEIQANDAGYNACMSGKPSSQKKNIKE